MDGLNEGGSSCTEPNAVKGDGGGEEMVERKGDNDRGKGCSINNVHLQLGGLKAIVRMYKPRYFHPNILLYDVSWRSYRLECRMMDMSL